MVCSRDGSVVELCDELVTGALGEDLDGLPLPAIAVLVGSDIGRGARAKVGECPLISLCHFPNTCRHNLAESSNSAGHASVVLPPPGRGAFPETIVRARSSLCRLPSPGPSGRVLRPLTPRQATPVGMVGPLGMAPLVGSKKGPTTKDTAHAQRSTRMCRNRRCCRPDRQTPALHHS